MLVAFEEYAKSKKILIKSFSNNKNVTVKQLVRELLA